MWEESERLLPYRMRVLCIVVWRGVMLLCNVPPVYPVQTPEISYKLVGLRPKMSLIRSDAPLIRHA